MEINLQNINKTASIPKVNLGKAQKAGSEIGHDMPPEFSSRPIMGTKEQADPASPRAEKQTIAASLASKREQVHLQSLYHRGELAGLKEKQKKSVSKLGHLSKLNQNQQHKQQAIYEKLSHQQKQTLEINLQATTLMPSNGIWGVVIKESDYNILLSIFI